MRLSRTRRLALQDQYLVTRTEDPAFICILITHRTRNFICKSLHIKLFFLPLHWRSFFNTNSVTCISFPHDKIFASLRLDILAISSALSSSSAAVLFTIVTTIIHQECVFHASATDPSSSIDVRGAATTLSKKDVHEYEMYPCVMKQSLCQCIKVYAYAYTSLCMCECHSIQLFNC